MTMFGTIGVTGSGALLATTLAASAQTFASRPITMVIPVAAGGPPDVLGHVHHVSLKLGAVIVSDQRAAPEYLAAFVKSETEKWAARSRSAGPRPTEPAVSR